MENMDHYIKIIHTYPAGSMAAFDMTGHSVPFLLEPKINIIWDSFYLRNWVSFTDHKKICWRVVQFSEVQFNNIFSFDIPDAINDQII